MDIKIGSFVEILLSNGKEISGKLEQSDNDHLMISLDNNKNVLILNPNRNICTITFSSFLDKEIPIKQEISNKNISNFINLAELHKIKAAEERELYRKALLKNKADKEKVKITYGIPTAIDLPESIKKRIKKA